MKQNFLIRKKNNFCLKLANVIFISLLTVVFNVNMLQAQDREKSRLEELYEESPNVAMFSHTISQYNLPFNETFVLLQSRMGIRVEYCLDRSNLQLWISPKAWKSVDYRDRNWSNRDDHTNVFERITFQGMSLRDFEKCDYDPFHSVLYFKSGQKLHIATVYDKPVVMVWLEKDGVIDFKTDNVDKLIEKTEKVYYIEHPDRGRTFEYMVTLGEGDGYLRHQRDYDEWRSMYLRAELKAGQVLFITAEEKGEGVKEIATEITKKSLDELLAENNKKLEEALQYGKLKLKDNPEMQKVIDVARSHALSMQDGGMMRSSNQYIYYLRWFRDGGMNTPFLCYSGWAEPSAINAHEAILNPIPANDDSAPKGDFYGCLVAGPLGKWEEDGIYYVTWPAFAYWTQTGDKTYLSGKYLENLEAGMKWIEDYCFNEEKGMFKTYYYCETPYKDGREYGYDDAVGNPVNFFEFEYEGKVIAHAYDIYRNLLYYATYMMLAAADEERTEEYMNKAKNLEKSLQVFLHKDRLPDFGHLIAEDGTVLTAKPNNPDKWDYGWSVSIPPFKPNMPAASEIWLQGMYDYMMDEVNNGDEPYLVCTYNAVLTAMDNEFFDEDILMEAMEKEVEPSVRPGKYYPMGYTVPEMLNYIDGDPFHDVKPLVYSSAPWVSALSNLGVRRLPFGIAMRATKYLEGIEKYQYQKGELDISFTGSGELDKILINGKKLEGTWQIPIDRVKEGANTIEVVMKENVTHQNVLIASTVQLNSMSTNTYKLTAYSQNILTFKNISKKVEILDKDNKPVEFKVQKVDEYTYIEFEGGGDFLVKLK